MSEKEGTDTGVPCPVPVCKDSGVTLKEGTHRYGDDVEVAGAVCSQCGYSISKVQLSNPGEVASTAAQYQEFLDNQKAAK